MRGLTCQYSLACPAVDPDFMRRGALVRLLGWWLGLLALPAAAQPGPVVLRDTARDYPLGRYCAVLAASGAGAELTLEQVRSPYWARRFRPGTQDVPYVQGGAGGVWLRCAVRNAAGPDTRWLLRAGQEFDAYLVDAAGRVRYRQSVRYRGASALAYAVPDRRFSLRLPLPPGPALTLYLRAGNGLLAFSLVEENRLHQLARRGDVGAAVYFATLLALLLYNLLLYFPVRDRSYLYYVLFVGAFAALQAHLMGYLPLLLRPWLTAGALDVLEVGLLMLTAVFSILTARAFLETARLVPRLDRGLRAVMGLAGALLLSSLVPALGPLTYWLGYLVPLSTIAGLLAAGVAVLRAGFRPARYYLAGWVLLMAAIVLFYLRSLGVVPVSFLTENGVRIASALEVILISLGLADRINLARRDKALAQAEALAGAREKEEV